MIKTICNHCHIEFLTHKKNRRFCTHFCFTQSKIGTKQKEITVEKRREKMIGQKYTAERCENIKKSRQKKLNEENLNELKYLLDFGMPDGYIMKKLNLSQKVFGRYKKELYPNGILWQCKFLEKDIELEVIQEIIKLSALKIRYKRIAKLTGIYHKTVRLILKSLSKKNTGIFCYSYDDKIGELRKESSIEIKIREFLSSENIVFNQEAQIEANSKWLFDFHIISTNLLIEVNGDYWHCNPKIYSTPINQYQKWAIRRDFAKKDYAKSKGYYSIHIWEHDIENDFNSVKQHIKENIEKCKLTQ